MPGVSTWNFGEAFAHLYLDSVAMNHNAIGRGYETFWQRQRRNHGAHACADDVSAAVVSGAAAARELPLVGARQCQLQRDRRA
jgi:hypothetical protein